MSVKIDRIIKDIATIPTVDTEAITESLRNNLPTIVKDLVDQQVAFIKQQLETEYQAKVDEVYKRAFTVDAVIQNHEKLNKLKEQLAIKKQKEREARMEKTIEYASLFYLTALQQQV